MSVDTNIREGVELIGYRLEAVIGLGGMGVVYRAVDLRLKRTVALKLMAPDLALDERFRERFAREAELAMSLEHPNVIPIHDAGEVEGRLFLAMRLVEGGTLRSVLREDGFIASARALAIVRQVANALDAAHAKGLVHRDVKPSNVLLDANEHVYLADFGLTRRLDEEGARVGDNRSLGTPAYLAPEQIEGRAVDGRADVYSLGCLLYECLAGEPPFARGSRLAVAWAHLEEDPPAVSAQRPELPVAVDGVLAKAMAKDPAERHATCAALVGEAEHALGLDGHVPRRRWVIAAVAAALALAAASLAAALVVRGDEASAAPAVKRDTLVHVDPATNSITKTIAVGRVPLETVVAGDTVWVYSVDGSLVEIDAATKTVRRTTTIPLGASFPTTLTGPVLAADDGGAWLVGADPEGVAGRLVHVLPGGAGIRKYKLTGPMPDAVALGGGAVWVLQTGGELGEKDEVVRIDPVNGRMTRRTALPGFLCPLGGGLTVSAGKVWVTDPKTGGLYRIDMETGALVRRDLGDEAARPVAGFGAIWVCAANPGSSMLRVDPDNIRATFVAAGIPPEDGTFAVGGGSIWRHDEPNGTLLRFEPNGRLAATVRITPTPPDMDLPSLKPTAVAVGAGGVWVTVAHF